MNDQIQDTDAAKEVLRNHLGVAKESGLDDEVECCVDELHRHGLLVTAERDAQIREDERAKMLVALRHEQRLHGGAIGESPAQTDEQAARDYGAAVAINQCIEIIAKGSK